MATQSHGFENVTPPPFDAEVVPQEIAKTGVGEKSPEILEVVQVPTLVEIPEILEAGAGFATYQSVREELDETGPFPVPKKITTVYLAAKRENIDKLLTSGRFGGDWKEDVTTYPGYVCLTSETVGTLANVNTALREIFHENVKRVDSDMYVWNKKHS